MVGRIEIRYTPLVLMRETYPSPATGAGAKKETTKKGGLRKLLRDAYEFVTASDSGAEDEMYGTSTTHT